MKLIRQCAWCRKILETGREFGSDLEPYRITHTICRLCSAALLEKAEKFNQKASFPDWPFSGLVETKEGDRESYQSE
jgi:hypothetical protein